MANGPFDFLNDINGTKANRIRGSDMRESEEKQYNKFLTARSLSYFQDTVAIVNELNIHGTAAHGITPMQHYEFLLYSVPKGRRFGKWAKPELESRVELIQECYGYSYVKARAVADLLTEDDYQRLLASRETGGTIK